MYGNHMTRTEELRNNHHRMLAGLPASSFDTQAASIGSDRLPVSTLPSYSERAGWDTRPPKSSI